MRARPEGFLSYDAGMLAILLDSLEEIEPAGERQPSAPDGPDELLDGLAASEAGGGHQCGQRWIFTKPPYALSGGLDLLDKRTCRRYIVEARNAKGGLQLWGWGEFCLTQPPRARSEDGSLDPTSEGSRCLEVRTANGGRPATTKPPG